MSSFHMKTLEERQAWYAWYDEHQRKNRARTKTNIFVNKTGLKKLPCVCGRADVQMHHPDYEKPLDIAFLCSKCHTAEHLGRLCADFVIHDLRELAVAELVAFP